MSSSTTNNNDSYCQNHELELVDVIQYDEQNYIIEYMCFNCEQKINRIQEIEEYQEYLHTNI